MTAATALTKSRVSVQDRAIPMPAAERLNQPAT